MARGPKRVDQISVLTMAAYNLTRMRILGNSVCRRREGREMQKSEAQNAENGSKRTGKFIMRKDEVKIKQPKQYLTLRVECFSNLLKHFPDPEPYFPYAQSQQIQSTKSDSVPPISIAARPTVQTRKVNLYIH